MTTKLALTALLALAVGAGGTYATIRVTATCSASPTAPLDDGLKSFLAKPDAPLTGYPTYK
jgi:hypothetical protein